VLRGLFAPVKRWSLDCSGERSEGPFAIDEDDAATIPWDAHLRRWPAKGLEYLTLS
jgi:hypothetical protein